MTRERVAVAAPAKVNLGLEILGRRPDGFHELRSVMAMVNLHDTVTVALDPLLESGSIPGVPSVDNLVERALSAFGTHGNGPPRLTWSIEKRIPIAAGLGGASADAAAALVAANALTGAHVGPGDLNRIAAGLGSDIPFFLGAPCALASGRGTDVAPLPVPHGEILLIAPHLHIPRKTATMYGKIDQDDYSGGERVAEITAAIKDGHNLEFGELLNSFTRPLYQLYPRLGELRDAIETQNPPAFGLSGAGPAHYALGTRARLAEVADALELQFGSWITTYQTTFRQVPISPVGTLDISPAIDAR